MPLFKIAIYQMSPSHHYPKIPNQRGIIFSQLKPAWVKDSVSAFQAFVWRIFFGRYYSGGWPVFYWLMRFFSAHDSRVVIAIFFAKCPFLIYNIKAYQGLEENWSLPSFLSSRFLTFRVTSIIAKFGPKMSFRALKSPLRVMFKILLWCRYTFDFVAHIWLLLWSVPVGWWASHPYLLKKYARWAFDNEIQTETRKEVGGLDHTMMDFPFNDWVCIKGRNKISTVKKEQLFLSTKEV